MIQIAGIYFIPCFQYELVAAPSERRVCLQRFHQAARSIYGRHRQMRKRLGKNILGVKAGLENGKSNKSFCLEDISVSKLFSGLWRYYLKYRNTKIICSQILYKNILNTKVSHSITNTVEQVN